jgi:hypothetical protein
MDDLLLQFGGAVKATPDGRVEGLLVPFADPEKLDLDGEFFDAETDFDREFPTTISTYYDHGLNREIGKKRLTRATVEVKTDGVWLSDQLDLSDDYQAMIYELAKKERLYLSSGAVPHLVEKEKVGKAVRIKSWPLGEGSYTVTPANPNAIVRTFKSYARERALTALEAVLTDTGDETASAALLSLKTLWELPTTGDDLPAGPFADHSQSVLAAVSEYARRARELHELRAKSGRVLSAANRERLSTLLAGMSEAMASVTALLDETAPKTDEPAAEEKGALRLPSLRLHHELLRQQMGATV